MAWTTSYVKKLRYLIGDIGVTTTYTDTQLQTFIAIAAEYVFAALDDYDINGNFVVDLAPTNPTITPDPDGVVPIAVSNLISLYAALIINRQEVKTMLVSGGIKVIDNKSTIDTNGQIAAAKVKQGLTFESQYNTTLREFEMGNGYAGCGIFNISEPNM